MKTTDPRDPLDRRIDALLASRPLPKSDAFTQRVLQATVHSHSPQQAPALRRRTQLLRYALPLAAALALSASFLLLKPADPAGAALSVADVQEILLFEAALGELSQLNTALPLDAQELAQALEHFYLDLKS